MPVTLTDDQWDRLKKNVLMANVSVQAANAVVQEMATPVPPPTPIPPPLPAPPSPFYPAAQAWMTEDEEVNWMNSLGFSVSVADLRASYAKFVPKQEKGPTTSVQNSTESDDLRNYYRLWKRTKDVRFLQQAAFEHDWNLAFYSVPTAGPAFANVSHFYMMGLIDWWIDHQDTPTLEAINRLLDFIIPNITPKLIETRSTARPLQCLAYYKEKVGLRNVDAPLAVLVGAAKGAPVNQGFLSMPKFYVGGPWTVDGQPPGTDLRILFPANATHKNPQGVPLIRDATHFDIQGFAGAASFQDCMMMHALGIAGRVTGDPALTVLRDTIAQAYVKLTGFPVFDKQGLANNLIVPYTFVTTAPDLAMFMYRGGGSTPLYTTQYAAFCPDPQKRRALSQQALLRQYSQYDKILQSEFGKPPRFYLWETWEAGYFLTQRPKGGL